MRITSWNRVPHRTQLFVAKDEIFHRMIPYVIPWKRIFSGKLWKMLHTTTKTSSKETLRLAHNIKVTIISKSVYEISQTK